MDYSRICSENICSQCKFYNTQNQDDICTKRETTYWDFNINGVAWKRPGFFSNNNFLALRLQANQLEVSGWRCSYIKQTLRTLPKFDNTLLLDFNNQRLKRVLSTFDERGVTKVYSGADPQIDLNMDLSNTDQTGCGFEFGLWVWILISQMKVWICRNQVWIQISGFGSVNLGLCGIAVS